MAAVQPDKWEPLIEQMNRAEELPEKFNLLATMVRMLATNDLSCMEGRIDELSRKFEGCMRRIYIVGIAIAVMIFTGVEIRSVVGLILKLVK